MLVFRRSMRTGSWVAVDELGPTDEVRPAKEAAVWVSDRELRMAERWSMSAVFRQGKFIGFVRKDDQGDS